MGEVGRLDGARRPRRGPAHVVAVVPVVVVMVVVVVQVWRLCGRAPVRPLLLVKVAHALVVTLELVAEQGVLFGGALLVIFEATDAVQPLEVDPSAPHHAHAIHDQPGSQVHLQTERSRFTTGGDHSKGAECVCSRIVYASLFFEIKRFREQKKIG